MDHSTDPRTKTSAPATPSIGVIGSGYWGKNLIRNYNRIGALKLICDKDGETLDSFRSQYPEVKFCVALNEMLGSRDLDGVVISTPAETHFRIAREALLAGKHVYVEKPLVLREEEAEELIDIAERRCLVLMVGHLLQYHPAFVKLKELAKAGELGRINYIYSHRLNLGKFRREENILWSFAPHDISMILSLAGEEPERVTATGGNYLHSKIADVTTTHLDFPSGLKAHIFVSWLHPFKEQKLVVVGDRRMAVFDDTQGWQEKLLLYPHEIRWRDNMPVANKSNPERVVVEEMEPLLIECEHFLKCVSLGESPLTDGREGLRVLRVLNEGQRSLDNGKGPGFSHEVISGGRKERKKGSRTFEDVRTTSRSRDGGAVSELPYFVHPTAILEDNSDVGGETKIWHFSHVLSGSRIGNKCSIGQNVVIGPDVTIGDYCKIQNNVCVYKGVTLEEGVFCGPSMVFTNVYNPRAEISKMDQVRPTLVRKGATIGANATIVCGITVGRYAFIGAGAVVTRSVRDHALSLGNPARQVGWVCRCGERLSGELVCLACGRRYEMVPDGLSERSVTDLRYKSGKN